ncbi:MAG: ATP-grasp domain-containing protein [Bacteroidales bacterium]
MKIIILYNKPGFQAGADELDVLDEVKLVSQTLKGMGHESYSQGVGFDLSETVTVLRKVNPDLVFNLAESIENHGMLVHVVPALLSALDIPFTGNTMTPMFLSASKILTRKELKNAGLPVAPACTLQEADSLPAGRYILKPVWEEGSLGLEEDAVFSVPGHDVSKIKSMSSEKYFIESFIGGREFNVSLLAGENGPQVLAVAEILFEGFPEEKPKVLGYRSKWDEGSFEYQHTNRTYQLGNDSEKIMQQLSGLASECWTVMGLQGYARVDFRMDADGNPFILEVNANPCISPGSGFYAACVHAGIPFSEVLKRLIQDALKGRS